MGSKVLERRRRRRRNRRRQRQRERREKTEQLRRKTDYGLMIGLGIGLAFFILGVIIMAINGEIVCAYSGGPRTGAGIPYIPPSSPYEVPFPAEPRPLPKSKFLSSIARYIAALGLIITFAVGLVALARHFGRKAMAWMKNRK